MWSDDTSKNNKENKRVIHEYDSPHMENTVRHTYTNHSLISQDLQYSLRRYVVYVTGVSIVKVLLQLFVNLDIQKRFKV